MTLLRMKRNSEPLSRLVIQVDDVEATQTLRTVQLDFFRLQLIRGALPAARAPSRCFLVHPYHIHEPLGTGYAHGGRSRTI
jgi:hypothetical protein